MIELFCIEDQEIETSGIFKKTEKKTKIDGITKGNVYTGSVFPEVGGGSNYNQAYSVVKFFIWNDNSEWEFYDVDLFQPRIKK